jgi:hypothetical protein
MSTTQLPTRQISDGAITDAKIAAGAGIQSSKLADGNAFVKSDGSIAFAQNQSMGGNTLTNVATPTGNNDAANKSYVDGLIAGLNSLFDSKPSARVATTANITLSGTQTIDTVAVVAGDRVLVKSQTAAAQNGIYVVAAGAWTRALDMDAWNEIPGALVAVEEGSINADILFLCTSNSGGTLNTTSITWQQVNGAGLSASNFVDKETPSGLVNGANTSYTLANTPVAGSEHVYLNGLLQEAGAGNDYTISANTITMLTAPLSGEKIRISYRK